jgi:hypothetical protein
MAPETPVIGACLNNVAIAILLPHIQPERFQVVESFNVR